MIELNDALNALRKVVAERGEDFVYEGSCVYQFEGQPACIVGHVLAHLLPEWWRSTEIVKQNLSAFQLSQCGLATADAADALEAAQVAQDTGLTWGEALEAAERNEF
jgi:hypothetical protein